MTKTFSAPDQAYFLRLADYSRGFVDRMGTKEGMLPLDRILGEMKSAIEAETAAETARLGAIPCETASRMAQPERAAGLNTAGLLADRLTILIIKEARLRSSVRKDDVALGAITNVEIPGICQALAQAEPGHGAPVGKVSTIRVDVGAKTWAEAYYGLLGANLLLWEAQEVLYTRDILSLPSEELRSYIRWFSVGNMTRNEYIMLCDRLIWTPGKRS